jgi:aminoglycoside phosphotransferase
MADPDTIPMPEPAAGIVPRDDALPAVTALLAPGAGELLAPAVAERGGRIEATRARFVNYTPGRRIAVRYSARVAWPNGRVRDETLVAMSRSGGPPSGSIPVEVAGTTVGVWRYPDDPRLPGIRAAIDPKYVRGLLDGLGAAPGELRLSYRAYWPTRRAVVQATIPSRKLSFDPAAGKLSRAASEKLLFLKIVRPGEVEALYRLHERLRDGLPTPRCLGWDEELGILVLEALPGQTISGCLSGDGGPPPSPDELLALLGRLGKYEVDGEPRRTTGQKIENHVRLLSAILPDQAETLAKFRELYGEQREQPLTTVHGDFHEEQVLVQGGRVSGLLDIDDTGPGQLVDDLGLMVGRVRARAQFAKRGREAAQAYEQRLLEAFDTAVDPDELRHRAAGALLGRATSPFRSQMKGWPRESRERIRMAETWLQRWARDRDGG